MNSEEDIAAALRPLGWLCGEEFWKRYYTDPWVFSLVNSLVELQGMIPDEVSQQVM